jgi:enoyl-CoA hydratase/carnithine racemase
MIFLTSTQLETIDRENITSHRGLTIAFAAGDLRGRSAAAALHCDWLAVADNATITIDSPAAWSGAIGRIGARAYRLHLLGSATLAARDAVREGLADVLVPAGGDPVEWLAGWIGGRSTRALDAAAALIRGRGGDVTERFEFARLFATGQPQEGLAAFLEKRRPEWTLDESKRD